MKKILIITLSLLIVGFALYNILWSEQQAGGVRIGFIGSLTGVDPAFGESMKNGVVLAVDEINKSGGIQGRHLEVIFEDGQCINGTKALSSAYKLIYVDRVDVILGGGCSNEALAIKPLVEKEGVLFVSSGASNPKLTENNKGMIFRNGTNDAVTGAVLSEYVFKDYHSVAVLSEKTEYADGLRRSFTKKFEDLGGVVKVDRQSISSDDFRSDLIIVKKSDADAVFLNGQSASSVGLMVRQARELGIKSQLYVAYFNTPKFYEVAGRAAQGTVIITTPNLVSDKQKMYLEKYEIQFGSSPAYPYYSIAAFDATMYLAKAMNKVGDNPELIAESLHGSSYEGVIGSFSFDRNGDVGGIKYSFTTGL